MMGVFDRKLHPQTVQEEEMEGKTQKSLLAFF
jgi:hypothetical protein